MIGERWWCDLHRTTGDARQCVEFRLQLYRDYSPEEHPEPSCKMRVVRMAFVEDGMRLWWCVVWETGWKERDYEWCFHNPDVLTVHSSCGFRLMVPDR